jgi:glucan phosphoethanolaminetransferase (alkaline phosphatase superfamily)
MGGLIFKELEANKYAFRRKFFVIAQNTMMHGLVTFDSDNNLVIVKGYADWSLIAVSVLVVIIIPLLWLIGGGPYTQDVFVQILCFVSFYAFITAISLFVEYYRLRTITKIASELWSRKYVINTESAYRLTAASRGKPQEDQKESWK